MRLLIYGDIHEKFFVDKNIEKADVIIFNGDFIEYPSPNNVKFSKEELEEKYSKVYDFLEKLSKYNKPVLIIPGNVDSQAWELKIFQKLEEIENVYIIHNRRTFEYKGYNFAGLGILSVGEQLLKDEEKRDYERILEEFEKVIKDNPNNLIFVYHLPPLGFFDLVLFRKSPRYLQSIGSQKELEFMLKYKPKLVIVGHMHEYSGEIKFGSIRIVHPGFRKSILVEI